ncbi:MAG: NusG domain II-containing protein [Ruminococcus sp.]|nr:NusG domain II-containing protein [Ruminococcus sp.]
MKNAISKNKLAIAIIILILIICIIWIFFIQKSGEAGAYATVKISGKTSYTLNLQQSQTLKIQGKNNLKVIIKTENGCIWVEHSECPDKICEHKGKISQTNENIVCLPAEVVIEVKSKDDRSNFDAVA